MMNYAKRKKTAGPGWAGNSGELTDILLREFSVFAVVEDARLWNRILAIGIQTKRCGRIIGQLIETGCELVLAVKRIVEGDDLARVSSHPAHSIDQAGLGAAFDLVVRFVVTNGIDQVIPFELVRTRLRLREC